MGDPIGFVTEHFTDGTQRTRLDRLTDGRVMCCLCFDYVTRDRLAESDDPGVLEDVCRPCKALEAAAAAASGIANA